MIDRASNNAQASAEDANYDAINAILDAAEGYLLGLAAEHQLREINIERWRWDQPEIAMSWSPRGGLLELGKNIRVFVSAGGSSTLMCSVESNAWVDEHQPNNSITRHWDNFPDRGRKISTPERLTQLEFRWLKDRIERAYDRISETGQFVLSHAVRMYPNATSASIDAPLRVAQNVIAIRAART